MTWCHIADFLLIHSKKINLNLGIKDKKERNSYRTHKLLLSLSLPCI